MNFENRSTINTRPDPDALLAEIADYVCDYKINSSEAYATAKLCLMDSLSCALMSLSFTSCTQLLGPIVKGATLSAGAKVPGTAYQLDPVQAAFNSGVMIRWLDFNDTWLAAEWGHPSDNLGGILAVSDYLSRVNISEGKAPLLIEDIYAAMIKAYEVQGILALENSFNLVGLDHVLLVKVASTAVITHLLGGTRDQIIDAISNAWMDGGTLRAYRHAPNTGTRKSWAAGDATSRAVQLALMTLKGEMGYPSVLSTKNWGFFDVFFNRNHFKLEKDFASYVIENILFKIAFPAEFHAQTAVEAAVQLYPDVKNRVFDISQIQIETQQAAMRIINKTGELHNPADRDHCLQYMVAVALLYGNLTAEDYEEERSANDCRIDDLRTKMQVAENQQFSQDYLNPAKRSITNSIQVFYKDGSNSEKIMIEYPLGHRNRREEAIPLLERKFEIAVLNHYDSEKVDKIRYLFSEDNNLMKTKVNEMMDLFAF